MTSINDLIQDPVDVFGWAADNAGCCWYRIETPLRELERRGRAVAFSRYLPRSRPNVIIGQRVSMEGPSRLWQALSRSPDRPRLIYELDDDLFHVDPENTAAYALFSDPAVSQRIRDNIAVADAVTVSTEALARQVRPYNASVHVIPNYLPEGVPVGAGTPSDLHKRPVTIGWAGSGTHARDFAEAGPEIARFVRRTPEAQLRMVGAMFPSVRGAEPKVTRWVPNVPAYYGLIAHAFDIGVAPLAPTLFNRSKSPVKALEYAALGIPTVASDVGPYADYIDHGVDGLLVRRPHEWSRYLRDLTFDSDLRCMLANAALSKAQTQTIGQHIGQWEKVIDDAVVVAGG